jgi:hypothetical protein
LGEGFASTMKEVGALILQDEVDPILIALEGLEMVMEELELYSFFHM